MADKRFDNLESPFLDEEVLPAAASEGRAESFTDDLLGEESFDGEVPVVEHEPDAESEDFLDVAETLDEDGSREVDSAEREQGSAWGGHRYEDFVGIEDEADTAESSFGAGESVDEETEQQAEWGEAEAEDESSGEFGGEAPEGELAEVEETDQVDELTGGDAEERLEGEDGPGGGGGVAQTTTVTILLDEPLDRDDRYQLSSSDGKYNKTLGPADAKALVDGAKILTFGGVSPQREYELVQIRAKTKGASRTLVRIEKFDGLIEAGRKAPAATSTYLTFPSQVPKKLPDLYGSAVDVDPILLAPSPVLVGLAVQDPKI